MSPPAFPEPLRSRRPWRSYPTTPVQPPSSRAGPPQPLALRAPAGPLCCPGHAGRAVGRGRGLGVFASGWGWGCAAGVVAQKYYLFFLFAPIALQVHLPTVACGAIAMREPTLVPT